MKYLDIAWNNVINALIIVEGEQTLIYKFWLK